jgi:hypothetical protein
LIDHPSLKIGKAVEPERLDPEYFQAEEGFVKLIYGRIRQGKSTEAVRVMVEGLSNGKSVYSNIALDLRNLILDDRINIPVVIGNSLTFRKRFYAFDTQNYTYFDPVTGMAYQGGNMDEGKQVFNPTLKGDEIRWLNTLTDCIVVYDEGQWLLDSYESTFASVAKRKLITETGHVNRTIVIVAQRTQSVHVNARGNVNQFYRCSKKSILGLFTILMVEEFQDMKGQDVDELAPPIHVNRYLFHRKYWGLFNTHYLRRGRPRSQEVKYLAYDLNVFQRFQLIFWSIFARALPAFKGGKRSEHMKHKKNKIKSDTRDSFTGSEPSSIGEIPLDEGLVPRRSIVDNIPISSNKHVTLIPSGEDLDESELDFDYMGLHKNRGKRVKIAVTTLKSEEAEPIVPPPDKEPYVAPPIDSLF